MAAPDDAGEARASGGATLVATTPAGSTDRATIWVIVGPTAAGKSGYAMALAEREEIAIISADSRQIYRGFDTGTAKPSAADQARVPHYGIDVVEPTESYSAYRWAQDAAGWIADARARGLRPVIVGGTGFYVMSLFAPPYDDPPVPAIAETPEYRVIDPGPVLRDHIETRVRQMLDAGWVAEVERLMRDVPPDAIAWKSTGYRNIRRHLEGEISLEYAIERTVIETRQYAKRQRTWFRHQLPPTS